VLGRPAKNGTLAALEPLAGLRASSRGWQPSAGAGVDAGERAPWTESERRDSTVKKVREEAAPRGAPGQRYLVSGKRVSMRLWRDEVPDAAKPAARRDYETVGYVIGGRAGLRLEGQMIRLEPGDCWLVPPDAEHSYRILEPLTAIEATAPPAQAHGRDQS